MAESITVEHHLGLLVCPGHYVPNGPEGSGLDGRWNINNTFLINKHVPSHSVNSIKHVQVEHLDT